MVDFEDVKAAAERIRGVAVHTPVMTSTTIDEMTEASIFFKCENMQKGGAFKFRGAYNAVSQLSEDERKRGVITHSSGNHAQALALASTMLDVKSTIVMPKNSPRVKVEATEGYGANIVFCENTVESRAQVAGDLIEKHGFILVHPYNDERIVAGAGTAALELIQEVGDLDFIFAPVGGGGLVSGTALTAKGINPATKVIAAEPKNADDAYRSVRDGRIYPSVKPNTIADGLRTQLAELTFNIIREYVDEVVTVTEQEIVDAMRLLWERMKLVVEPSGAVSLAGVLKMRADVRNRRVGVIISGGNVDVGSFFEGLLS
jgi:threonine dehydratase